jgi:rhodanese-related sulfurtransferase
MKKIFKTVVFIFLTISIIGCNNKKPSKIITENGEINVVTVAEFKEKSANQIIIDVRTPEEFESGHIEGAININVFDKTFTTKLSKLDKSIPIFMYCKSGGRSFSAAKKASNLGFEKIYDLQGGIINWARNNYEVTK